MKKMPTPKTLLTAAAVGIACLFAENAKAQTTVPLSVLSKDTVKIKAIYTDRNGGVSFVSAAHDTLRLHKTDDGGRTTSGRPHVTVTLAETGKGYDARGKLIVENADDLFMYDKLSGAQAALLRLKVGDGAGFSISRARREDIGTRLTAE